MLTVYLDGQMPLCYSMVRIGQLQIPFFVPVDCGRPTFTCHKMGQKGINSLYSQQNIGSSDSYQYVVDETIILHNDLHFQKYIWCYMSCPVLVGHESHQNKHRYCVETTPQRYCRTDCLWSNTITAAVGDKYCECTQLQCIKSPFKDSPKWRELKQSLQLRLAHLLVWIITSCTPVHRMQNPVWT